jgi:hypothetical protein
MGENGYERPKSQLKNHPHAGEAIFPCNLQPALSLPPAPCHLPPATCPYFNSLASKG